MIESFYKSYFDLKNTDERLRVMVQESLALNDQATVLTRFGLTIVDALPWFGNASAQAKQEQALLDKNIDQTLKWRSNYGVASPQSAVEGPPQPGSDKPVNPASQRTAAEVAPPGPSGKSIDQVCQQRAAGIPVQGMGDKAADQRPVNPNAGPDSVDTLIDAVNFLFFNASTFVCETGFSSMNPLTPIPIYWTILQLHETMNTFGLWYLPALYGMLGRASTTCGASSIPWRPIPPGPARASGSSWAPSRASSWSGSGRRERKRALTRR